MECKNLEDQIDSVPCLHLRLRKTEMLIHIPDLRRLHDITYDEELCAELISESDDLIELPTPDECTIVRCSTLLHALHDRHSSVGRYQ